MIRWKLNELMARKRIRNKDLAEALDITENSVYRLRKTDEMPRLTPQRLEGICAALECQPGELLEWVPDAESTFDAMLQRVKIRHQVPTAEALPAIAIQPAAIGGRLKVVPQEVFRTLAKFCDQVLALSWQGYKQYGLGAVIYINKEDGPEIAYIEQDKLPDPNSRYVIAQNRPEVSAVVLYYYGSDYDLDDYDVFTLTGPKSPPECYGAIV